ncbi:MAG: conserved hypothetical integral rane protein [Eubacterium sp.]|nr:conserved hypothetical integral rane protein [Eubacterium sp.]
MINYFFTYIDKIPKELHNSLFSSQHLLALGMVALTWIIIILLFKDKAVESKWKAVKWMALTLPVLEAAQMLWYKSIGEFSWGYTLPLHLCSLMSVLLPVMAFTRNRLLQEYSYAIGMAPALMTLLTPDVYYYPSLSFIYLQTMLVHGIICLIPLFMVFCMGFRPDIRRLPKVVGLLVCFAVLIVPVNYITDGNYFFLRYPAPGSPMEGFSQMVGSPWYLVPTLMLGCVLWFAFYLPFVLIEFVASRKKSADMLQNEAVEEEKPALMR